MHAHSNPAGQGPLGFESTKTRTAQPCKKPRVIRPRATGTSAIIVTIEGKARAGVAARCVRASGALPAGDVDGTRHDVHTVKSRGYNVNQLWEYELDPAARALRGEPSSPPR